MKNYISVFIIFSIILTFTSCGLFVKKVSFTKEELECFNVYKVNDIIIFQSLKTQQKDTSIIAYKSLNYQYNPIVADKRTQCMNVTYTNNKYSNNKNKTETLIFDCKDNNQYVLGLTYLKSNFKFDNTSVIKELETLSLYSKSFKNVHELKCKRMKFHGGTDDDPETLYWDKQYGIIKYITFKGEVWERVNW
ncbi:MAG: hypothetical protein O9297_09305 [Flavobacterium sp.]|uniref:hypothetical protein n=1 Tax=Flavobacterium sp. TaxID=239 RepID=UPI0022C64516|nr:hypothetical protein [Flavobacterium sp.]MCZ8297398.1 hypothetical protein [Flavobacterium sp.]